jgi:imidazolonepropionase-like amidohydrolase
MLTLTNARLFDGGRMLPGRHSVTIDGTTIAAVQEAARPFAGGGEVVDLGGMLLMPGLVSGHIHPDFFKFSIGAAQSGTPLGKELPPGTLTAIGIRTCRVLLESGFTGYLGASCSNDIDASLKIAIAEGIVPGPRIRACGHHIGTTADLNQSHHKWWKEMTSPGCDEFGDGPDALRKLVREEIRRGVETIKIFVSDGHDTARLARNMAKGEIAAIVQAAHERGAKVRAHACSKETILECIELGVDLIDHGDEVDEQCIEAMAKAGTFWVPSQQTPRLLVELGYGDKDGVLAGQVASVSRMLPIAHKAGVRILLGDDYSGFFRDMVEDDPLDHQVGNYGRELGWYGALDGVTPEMVMAWGTKNPGAFLVDPPAISGVIAPGALADLIVVDGDPMADLSIFAQPEQVLKAVIRDGALAIDRLPPRPNRIAA